MQFFSAALIFGFIAFVTCADQYEQYGPKPSRHSSHRTMKQSQSYQKASAQMDKSFNAEEVANILMNSVPGKDYPIFSLDYMPKTSFSCDGPNIHYPGYYADVEAGCQVFHFCPPKLEESYQPPQDSYQQPKQQGGYPQQQNQEEQYRKKRASYGQPQPMPATYYPQEQPTPMKPTYSHPKQQPQEARDTYQPQPQPQQYEQEDQLISFLCPNQTIFNQQTLVCEWFYNVVCEHAVQNYDLANSRLYHETAPLLDEVPVVEHPSNLPIQSAPQKQQVDYNNQQNYQPKPTHKMSRRPIPQQQYYN